jgi:hypothetical protein
MSYDALAFDSIAEKAILVERALALEQAVYDKMEQHVNDEYRSRECSLAHAQPSSLTWRSQESENSS